MEAAAREILLDAGWRPDELDLIIVATDTPEYVSPSTARRWCSTGSGAAGAGTFDLNTACAGLRDRAGHGSQVHPRRPRYRHVLVIGAYAMSKYLDLDDKKTVTLFADGAAGVILRATTRTAGWQAARLHTEGQYARLDGHLRRRGPHARHPRSARRGVITSCAS